MPKLLRQLTADPDLVEHYAQEFAKEEKLQKARLFEKLNKSD